MVHAGAIELNRDGVEEKSEKGKRSLEADVASPLSLSLSSIHRGRVKRPPLPSPSPPYIPDKFILIFLSRGGRRFYGFHAWTPFAHASTRRSSPPSSSSYSSLRRLVAFPTTGGEGFRAARQPTRGWMLERFRESARFLGGNRNDNSVEATAWRCGLASRPQPSFVLLRLCSIRGSQFMASPGHARRLVDETSLSRSVLDFGSVRGNPTTVRRFSFVSLSLWRSGAREKIVAERWRFV